ncbi:response regulator transcription factor [Qingshengfaniella alkalisoli]|uniref:Response regulator transcription factor n=1 Tax=Qingshengfaniella alkalisoli TaxID=2599296 RepID=A0A5B8I8V3_9RHOB|nr:response regulator transcription factor [Qingshengfaniella alkalisoli]QDY70525.1 response regulator transcription factor [Qingshengfaniella alkalisoli]
MTIRAMIIDDHQIFRQGVRSVLEDEGDITVIAEAANAAEALELAPRMRPDVVTVDIRLGGLDGIQLVRRLKSLPSPPGCVVLSTYEDKEYLLGALAAQADAYLLKSNSYETLASAIRAVHRGERTLSHELIATMMEEYRRVATQQIRRDSGLSPRDVQMLRILAAGGRSQDIADQLAMTEITVKRRVQEITLKLDAANRVQAVAEAIRRGVI